MRRVRRRTNGGCRPPRAGVIYTGQIQVSVRSTREREDQTNSPIFRTEEWLLRSLDGVDLTLTRVVLHFPSIAELAVPEVPQQGVVRLEPVRLRHLVLAQRQDRRAGMADLELRSTGRAIATSPLFDV